MNLLEKLSKNEIKELLIKGWMTHDAMWFFHAMQECGIEKANRINRSAVRTMAGIEAKRILKALGKKGLATFNELEEFMKEGLNIIKADFMKFELEFPSKNKFVWNIPGCFAYDGINKIGAAGAYDCGIVERAFGWFDSLGIKYECAPEAKGCQMHRTGACRWEFTFFFE